MENLITTGFEEESGTYYAFYKRFPSAMFASSFVSVEHAKSLLADKLAARLDKIMEVVNSPS